MGLRGGRGVGAGAHLEVVVVGLGFGDAGGRGIGVATAVPEHDSAPPVHGCQGGLLNLAYPPSGRLGQT